MFFLRVSASPRTWVSAGPTQVRQDDALQLLDKGHEARVLEVHFERVDEAAVAVHCELDREVLLEIQARVFGIVQLEIDVFLLDFAFNEQRELVLVVRRHFLHVFLQILDVPDSPEFPEVAAQHCQVNVVLVVGLAVLDRHAPVHRHQVVAPQNQHPVQLLQNIVFQQENERFAHDRVVQNEQELGQDILRQVELERPVQFSLQVGEALQKARLLGDREPLHGAPVVLEQVLLVSDSPPRNAHRSPPRF